MTATLTNWPSIENRSFGSELNLIRDNSNSFNLLHNVAGLAGNSRLVGTTFLSGKTSFAFSFNTQFTYTSSKTLVSGPHVCFESKTTSCKNTRKVTLVPRLCPSADGTSSTPNFTTISLEESLTRSANNNAESSPFSLLIQLFCALHIPRFISSKITDSATSSV